MCGGAWRALEWPWLDACPWFWYWLGPGNTNVVHGWVLGGWEGSTHPVYPPSQAPGMHPAAVPATARRTTCL